MTHSNKKGHLMASFFVGGESEMKIELNNITHYYAKIIFIGLEML